MKYIIMCGGKFRRWETPRQLVPIKGEPAAARTIRLLRECGVDDISVSTNNPAFECLGVPILKHRNDYAASNGVIVSGYWCDGFYPTDEPTCYVFGDVVFSPEAVRTIVETETDDIEFFGSAPPFAENYPKRWAEPFALKVTDTVHLKRAVEKTRRLADKGAFSRKPIMWELWQVIKGTQLNVIDYGNYTAINDYTCDIDYPEDVAVIEKNIP